MKNSLWYWKNQGGNPGVPISQLHDRSGDRPATYHSEPSGHGDERRESRRVLSTAPGNKHRMRSQGVGRSAWVPALSGRKEKSWSLKGKGPGQKRSSKANPSFPQRQTSSCSPEGLVVPQGAQRAQLALGTSRRLSSTSPFCPAHINTRLVGLAGREGRGGSPHMVRTR